MFRRWFLLIALLPMLGSPLIAQEITQTIRGVIKDKDTDAPMIGANVALYKDSALWGGAASDINGRYRIDNVPVGRYTLVASLMGYEVQSIPNVIVGSGKEIIMNLGLKESVAKLKEVRIVGEKNKGEAINKMATVSARQFSVEESERYAGSRGDPARMASNFAGVQGADDSRNDIVVRGNSPLGVLWRFEGINIPNPNHFAIAGTQGGPVSILNNKVLANSDFYTGAFPAEFGNSIAGVFDINMRPGNNETHEFTGQLGFLGTELTGEGPINKEKGSSYIANYRYSTLDLFSGLNIAIGTQAVPKYQDAAFKLNFPNKKGSFSVFGVGGISDIDILISEQHPSEREIFGEGDRDQFFGSRMGIVGFNWVRRYGKKAYGRLSVGQSYEEAHSRHEFIYSPLDSVTGLALTDADGFQLIDSLVPILGYEFVTHKTSLAYFVNYKINARNVIKAGVHFDNYFYNFVDSLYGINTTYQWALRWNTDGYAALVQPYVQWRFDITEKLVLNTGLHSQYWTLGDGNLSPIEPRLGLQYQLDNRSRLSAAFGLHSQLQPLYTYFYAGPDANGNPRGLYNQNVNFTRSIHSVLGYDRTFGTDIRIKLETYYQTLFDVPVTQATSSFSLVNQGSGFVRFFPDTLVNEGTGRNYGVDFTLEKFFSRQYFFMFTASLYESKYTGSDGVERDTDFNGNYVTNLLGAREFKITDNSNLTVGIKATYAGNRRYGPVDTAATAAAREIVFIDSVRNSFQFDPYFRFDLKLQYKLNRKKVAHEIGLDLVNLTGRQNVLALTYAPDPNDATAEPVREEFQLGFLPIFYYKIDF